MDIKLETVQNQFLTDCRLLLFGWRCEDAQRILYPMGNSSQFPFNPEPHSFNCASAVGQSSTLAQFVAAGVISAHFSGAAERDRSASPSTAAFHRIPSTRACVNSILPEVSAAVAGERPTSHQGFRSDLMMNGDICKQQ
jgi:hypothetical protein